jgi:uncharacterized repeat protein (TIGR02543 family)
LYRSLKLILLNNPVLLRGIFCLTIFSYFALIDFNRKDAFIIMKKFVILIFSLFIFSVCHAENCGLTSDSCYPLITGNPTALICTPIITRTMTEGCRNVCTTNASFDGVDECQCDAGFGGNGTSCSTCLSGQHGPATDGSNTNACVACAAGSWAFAGSASCSACGGTGAYPNTYCYLSGSVTIKNTCHTGGTGSDPNADVITKCYKTCTASPENCSVTNGHLSGTCYYSSSTSSYLNVSGTCTLTCDPGYHDNGLDECDINTYTITYYPNSGTCLGGTCTPTTYDITTATITLPIPTRSGYTFGGWYNNSGFTGSSITTIPTGSIGNKTFYAKWAPETFTINLDYNGGTGTPATVTCTIGTPCPLPTPSTAPSGYTLSNFDGWMDDPFGAGTNYGTSYSSPPSIVTLYAGWKRTIDFQNNYTPSTTYLTRNCYHGGNLSLPTFPPAPSSAFHASNHSWYQDNHGGTLAYSSITITTCDDASYSPVYPKWEYTVTYDDNNSDPGSVPAPGDTPCTKNQSCHLETIPAMTRTGYVLDNTNWNSNPAGTGTIYAGGGSILASDTIGDRTLYAKWTACATGTYYSSGSCLDCEAGYYCHSGIRTACPAGHTSNITPSLPDAKSDCYMSSGTKFCDEGGTRCFHLPTGVTIGWVGP